MINSNIFQFSTWLCSNKYSTMLASCTIASHKAENCWIFGNTDIIYIIIKLTTIIIIIIHVRFFVFVLSFVCGFLSVIFILIPKYWDVNVLVNILNTAKLRSFIAVPIGLSVLSCNDIWCSMLLALTNFFWYAKQSYQFLAGHNSFRGNAKTSL